MSKSTRNTLTALAGMLALGLAAAGCGDDDDAYPDCSSVCYHSPATGTCACAWECPPEEDDLADYEMHCQQGDDSYVCTCSEDEVETGQSFESDDICDVEEPEPQANAGCGWHVR